MRDAMCHSLSIIRVEPKLVDADESEGDDDDELTQSKKLCPCLVVPYS